MPCVFIAFACSLLSRIASRPPCTFGCSVLTRPSIISGKPVRSETSFTLNPAAAIALAVPPVETSSTPRAASAWANSIRPVLSETESRTRVTRRGWSVMDKILCVREYLCPGARQIKSRASRWCSIQGRQSRERALVSSFRCASQRQEFDESCLKSVPAEDLTSPLGKRHRPPSAAVLRKNAEAEPRLCRIERCDPGEGLQSH